VVQNLVQSFPPEAADQSQRQRQTLRKRPSPGHFKPPPPTRQKSRKRFATSRSPVRIRSAPPKNQVRGLRRPPEGFERAVVQNLVQRPRSGRRFAAGIDPNLPVARPRLLHAPCHRYGKRVLAEWDAATGTARWHHTARE